MIIYKVTNKINGKEYIGQTACSLKKRKSEHISVALNKRDSTHFHRVIRKYGLENFEWQVLYKCGTMGELNELEIYYIKEYNTFISGYNLTVGVVMVGYLKKQRKRYLNHLRVGNVQTKQREGCQK